VILLLGEVGRQLVEGGRSFDGRPIAIDLMCGAGGMSLGFEQAGFHVACAVDDNPLSTAAHRINFHPECWTLTADVRKLSGEELRQRGRLGDHDIDVVFGGPPCQGFSVGGRQRADDPRNALLLHFARLVKELHPRYFVLENVRGLIKEGGRYVEPFVRKVRRAGYSVLEPIRDLDARAFGVPQRRRRVFVVGWRRGELPVAYPDPLEAPLPTVWDAIGDLPEVDEVEYLLHDDVYREPLGLASSYAAILRGDQRDPQDRSSRSRPQVEGLSGCRRIVHSPETIRRFQAVPPGGQEAVSRFFRLAKDGVAPTLRAGSGWSHGRYTAPRPIHPLRPRCITVREAARLHSLPDWFRLHPTKWHGFSQVGNAVPPLLARAVAERVWEALHGRRE
jgi:DNA (cytosine-5)-methyltransferase 1